VLSLDALVRVKLTAFRTRDRMHLLDMLELGLIDASWFDRLSPVGLNDLGDRYETRDERLPVRLPKDKKGRIRVAMECDDSKHVRPQNVANSTGRAVAEGEPDNAWRRTPHEAQMMEIVVLRNDSKPICFCKIPDRLVIRPLK
jgi:hypothetical protein